jgi:hypothetical protein
MAFVNRQEAQDHARAMNKASLFDQDHWYQARYSFASGEWYVAKINTRTALIVERFYS